MQAAKGVGDKPSNHTGITIMSSQKFHATQMEGECGIERLHAMFRNGPMVVRGPTKKSQSSMVTREMVEGLGSLDETREIQGMPTDSFDSCD
jgi:hypothetical protein